MKDSAAAVLELMYLLDGACADEFAEHIHTARYSARIKELRDLGYIIAGEQCRRHGHLHRVLQYSVVAVAERDGQLSLVAG